MSLFASIPFANTVDVRVVDSVFRGQFLGRLFASPYRCNMRIGKPSVPMIQSVVMTVLIASVFIVFVLRAYAQMLWINARWIIASVHDYLAIRNFIPCEKRICVSVRSDANLTWQQEYSIPVGIALTLPKPTFRCFLYSALKYVIRPQDRVVAQLTRGLYYRIARSAKFPSYRQSITAENALDRSSGLVCHRASVGEPLFYALYVEVAN